MEFGSDPMGNLLRVLPERKQSLFNMLGPTLSNAWVLSNQSNLKKCIYKTKQLGQSFINLTHTWVTGTARIPRIYMLDHFIDLSYSGPDVQSTWKKHLKYLSKTLGSHKSHVGPREVRTLIYNQECILHVGTMWLHVLWRVLF